MYVYIHLRYSLKFSNTFSKVIPFLYMVTMKHYNHKQNFGPFV